MPFWKDYWQFLEKMIVKKIDWYRISLIVVAVTISIGYFFNKIDFSLYAFVLISIQCSLISLDVTDIKKFLNLYK